MDGRVISAWTAIGAGAVRSRLAGPRFSGCSALLWAGPSRLGKLAGGGEGRLIRVELAGG
jgi:hypothetical protein